jgi:hypothetical protein
MAGAVRVDVRTACCREGVPTDMKAEMDGLRRFIEQNGKLPLAWAGSTAEMNYLNLGDALSPVMVALCSGMDVTRIPTSSRTPRIAAVGTIGQAFAGGEVWFWGTGCSAFRNPLAKREERIPYQTPADTTIHIAATRGAISERLLSGGNGSPHIYGDPVWLLPRFYRPTLPKRWKLGVIVHLSELSDRAYEAHVSPRFIRYEIPPSLSASIRLINTVTPVATTAIRERLDEILSCERLVSTSLHGMVLAETYQIPCLHFGTGRGRAGLTTIEAVPDSAVDLRVLDFYSGLGLARFKSYNQHRNEYTDWDALMRAIDDAWAPKPFDEQRLLNAFPSGAKPVTPPLTGSVFDLPLLRNLMLQHDVKTVQDEDADRHSLGGLRRTARL